MAFVPDEDIYHYIKYLQKTLHEKFPLTDSFVLENKTNEFFLYFKQFKREYIQIYLEEHNKRVSWLSSEVSDIFEINQLKYFQQIYNFQFLPEFQFKSKLDSLIRFLQQPVCNINAREILEKNPTCICRYRLGQLKIEQNHLFQFKNKLNDYIKQIINIILHSSIESILLEQSEGNIKKQIKNYFSLLKSLNPQDVKLFNNFMDATSDKIITFIDTTLYDSPKIRRKSLKNLSEKIFGQIYNPKQLQKIFTDWIIQETDQLNGKDNTFLLIDK